MRLLPRRLAYGEEATLVEHLGELRARLVIVASSVVAGLAVSYAFRGHLLHWLNGPLPDRIAKPVTFSPVEPFTTSITVSFYAGLALALPIVVWQIWAFLAPAVQQHHQRTMSVLVLFATLLAACGIGFGYFVALPAAVHFLTNYDSAYYAIQIRAKDYYSFCVTVLFAVALVFELPLFVLGLVQLRILSAARLRRQWRAGLAICAVIAVALPGVDPVTTTLEMIPLMVLYGVSIVLAAVLERRRRRLDPLSEFAASISE